MAHQNPSDDVLRRILSEAQSIAVVGASSNPERPSNGIFGKLLRAGYRVVPVNPNEREVLAQPAYPRLEDVPGPIDIVNVFRRAEHTPLVAEQAVAAGARVLWLGEGIWNEAAAARATAGGLLVVMDECIGVVHSRLRLPTRVAPVRPGGS